MFRRRLQHRAGPVGAGPSFRRVLRISILAIQLAACSDDRATAPVEPGEHLPGGETTNTLLLGRQAFSMPAANITENHMEAFFSGNSFFNQAWVTAPSSTEARDGLGPLFNARSCSACHLKDGRGRPPESGADEGQGFLLRLSIGADPETGAPVPDPVYGDQLQPFGIEGIEGIGGEGRVTVTYDEVRGAFQDGTPYSLRVPTFAIVDPRYGPLDPDLRVSPRVAPAVVGLGLLEAIPIERIEALADPDDADGDGVSGRVQRVPDPRIGAEVVGRFGWKAERPSVLLQAAAAFAGDIGITSTLFPQQPCTDAQEACSNAPDGGTPEIEDNLLERVAAYNRLLAVPARERYDDAEVLRGKWLFSEIGCAACHVPSHVTAHDAPFPELADQRIWPYTDLLLHDMGEDLADDRPVFAATGREWRTPPLWGLRFYRVVNGHDRLLHDGRARGVAEAILWHGGEAQPAKEAFESLDDMDRTALVTFVESL
ncbi:MAG: thiol oxidoreductase [Deltaproteobacteria bacterium]|nr:MAG: thiol oxidoreductase [Deltaproteobacteria bacterium]